MLERLLDDVRKHPHHYSYKELMHKYRTSHAIVRGRINRAGLEDLIVLEHKSSLQPEDKVKLTNKELSDIVRAERAMKHEHDKHTVVERKYRIAQAELIRAQKEIEALTAVLEYKPKRLNINPRPNQKKNVASPFLVLSDWHVEELVDPRTVGGKNKYNLEIAKARSVTIFQNALKLMNEVEADMAVESVAIFMLGDFITGNIHLENIENAQLGPIPAVHYAQDLLESGLRFLLDNTKYHFTVYCKVGNHSRITQRIHASTEADNALETAMYVGMARNFRGEERIRFCIEPSYHSITVIQGTLVRYHHGHAVLYGGGIGGLHIPLRKAIKSWNETEYADIDIMGHFHSFKEHTTQKYLVNGSLIGYNAYAERVKAVLEPPIQGFGVFHSKYGATRLTPIYAE